MDCEEVQAKPVDIFADEQVLEVGLQDGAGRRAGLSQPKGSHLYPSVRVRGRCQRVRNFGGEDEVFFAFQLLKDAQ